MATFVKSLFVCAVLVTTNRIFAGYGFSFGRKERSHSVAKRDVQDVKIAPMTLDASCELVCQDSYAEYADDCTYECTFEPVFHEATGTTQIKKKQATIKASSTTVLSIPPTVAEISSTDKLLPTVATLEPATYSPLSTITTTGALTASASSTITTAEAVTPSISTVFSSTEDQPLTTPTRPRSTAFATIPVSGPPQISSTVKTTTLDLETYHDD